MVCGCPLSTSVTPAAVRFFTGSPLSFTTVTGRVIGPEATLTAFAGAAGCAGLFRVGVFWPAAENGCRDSAAEAASERYSPGWIFMLFLVAIQSRFRRDRQEEGFAPALNRAVSAPPGGYGARSSSPGKSTRPRRSAPSVTRRGRCKDRPCRTSLGRSESTPEPP